ncbi:MAG: tetratricopeptide repeat protein [Syntrophorhabdaceae bacterium]|nr:tetratricopeptide repeat protein [Syntrophorhabdaceae bacterium]
MSLILDALRKAQEERKTIFIRPEKKKHFIFEKPRKIFYFILAGGTCLGLVIFFLPVTKKTVPVHIQQAKPEKGSIAIPEKAMKVTEKRSIKDDPHKHMAMRKDEVKVQKNDITRTVQKKEIGISTEISRQEAKPISLVQENQKVNIKKEDDANIVRMFNQALSEAGNGRIDEAKKLYLKILEERPDYIDALNNLGVLAMMQGNSKEALSYYRKILEKSPHYGKAYNNMALILLKEGDRKLAEEYFRKAIEIDRDAIEGYINLSALLRSEKRLKEAEKLLEPLIKKGKEDPGLYLTYAVIKDEVGDTKDAIVYYRQYLRLAGRSEERNKVLERLKVLEDRDFTKSP